MNQNGTAVVGAQVGQTESSLLGRGSGKVSGEIESPPAYPDGPEAQGTRGASDEPGVEPQARQENVPHLDQQTLRSGTEVINIARAHEIARHIEDAILSVNREVIGRAELTRQAMYALLTREHQLIYSRRGMAKSLFARKIFALFEGAQVFRIQMTKGTPEEAVVGAPDIDELKRGSIIHNTEKTLVDADFAYLDEAFDANDVTLRASLGILHEREFVKGKQHENARLHTAIATTNFVRRNDLTDAVIDRFVFSAVLDPEMSQLDRLRIDRAYQRSMSPTARAAARGKIAFSDLSVVADIIEGRHPHVGIEAPSHVLFLKNLVVEEFSRLMRESLKSTPQADYQVSPRTAAKTRDVLNAAALLAGRETVAIEDLGQLAYMLPTMGDKVAQENFTKALSSVLGRVSKPDLVAVDALMAIEHALSYFEQNDGQLPDHAKGWWQRFMGWLDTSFGIRFGEKQMDPLHKMAEAVNSVRTSGTEASEVRSALHQRVALLCQERDLSVPVLRGAPRNPST